MKILIPVDPEIPVPPILYGGVERLVDGLIDAYTQKGHEVYLLAHKDSTQKNAKKIFFWLGTNSRNNWHTIQNSIKLCKVYHEIKPDIIHSFCRLLYLYPTMFTSRARFVMTYSRFISSKSTALASILGGTRMNFTSVSKHMLSHLKKYKYKFKAIYNFTLTDFFVPDEKRIKEYLFFLGRIEDIKGTKEAIEVALASKKKLIIAGNVPEDQKDYYIKYIKPHLDNPLIEYIGPVNDEQKRYYLQGAIASILPFKLKTEAFGLTIIESMSCGTPVITFNIAATPEIIEHRVDGYLAKSVAEMIEAIDEADKIDRNKVRENCVKRFSLAVISEQYLELFKKLIS